MATKREREKKAKRTVSAKARAEKHQEGFSRTQIKVPAGMPLWQMKKAGTYRIDVIPYEVGKGNPFQPEVGELHYERTYYTHRGVGANNDSYTCNRKTFNTPCPICDHRAKLLKKPDYDEDEVKNLAPKERQLFQIIDLAEPDKGVQLFESSHFLFGKLLDAKVRGADEDDGYEYFADLEQGKSLKLIVDEESFNGQSFRKVVDIEFKPRKTAYDEDILEKTVCLDDLPIQMDYDKLKALFLGEDPAGEEEDDEDETPKKKGKASKAPVEDDEDDDEDDDDSEEEEEEEEEEDDEIDDALAKGDKVSVKVKGKTKTGTITSINKKNGMAAVSFGDGKTAQAFKLDELEALEAEEEEEEEDDEEEAPKKKGKKVPVEDDEDDDDSDEDDDDSEEDDDDSEEEEEEEEEAPPVKKGKGKKAPVDDEEDDDDFGADWEDDDDEDEAPKKKPAPKKGKK